VPTKLLPANFWRWLENNCRHTPSSSLLVSENPGHTLEALEGAGLVQLVRTLVEPIDLTEETFEFQNFFSASFLLPVGVPSAGDRRDGLPCGLP
jgi:hypothetical protein